MKNIIFILVLFFTYNLLIFSFDTENTLYKFSQDAATRATRDVDINIFRANIAHGSLAAFGYLDMISLCIVGQIMLTDNYSGNNLANKVISSANGRNFTTYDALRLSHIILASSTYLLLGSSLIISYITLGIKIKKRIAINYPHFICSIITSGFYVLEIFSMVASGVFYATHNPYAKYIGVAHAVISYAFLTSYTVSLITLPLGRRYKKVLKNE